ncbi:beta-N-acetylhexosaminidase [Falsirhodobacter sp. 20TX0035]|uniref:beta-N-acetylhexosaminidase n=1 Tax=Falsirhodobacter sp. 20TX0035 TaxID=3022019 RepID=UPI00232CF1F7|nr:beta-N-acetylhexosaminidase [Falsirhodobacter sp. 20TX0035]MDB6453154.1 beta-N-acetylhexosaminidase [Falsirhodobacter sp. 20TX0035]
MIGRGAAIFGCDGTTLGTEEKAFFRDADPFGFILFARNVDTPDQLRRLTGELRDAVGRDAPILVDQEGGRVQRLRAPHWAEHLPALDMVARACDPRRAMELRFALIAAELKAVGIDANCAPVADVATEATHPFLRNRCYGTDPETVTDLARAAAEAHLAQGVLPVIKHMPGHGRATADSHRDLPTVTADRALLETDFAPFRALNHLPMAMTAHIVFSALDDRPATCSPVMIDLIRRDIGFDGLLMTDDIEMEALSGTVAERTRASLSAGCDVVLHCNGPMPARRAVAEAAGEMGPEARRRAEAALALRRPAPATDVAALSAELSDLLGA